MTEPVLLLFRNTPARSQNDDQLISSLQTLETSFFLIALGRYPHALITCASSIEAAIQASNVRGKRKGGLAFALAKGRRFSPTISSFPDPLMKRFREFRNRITHSGFEAKDAS